MQVGARPGEETDKLGTQLKFRDRAPKETVAEAQGLPLVHLGFKLGEGSCRSCGLGNRGTWIEG